MIRDDDDPFGKPARKPPIHEIGQALDALSVSELEERIAVLRAEIERIEAARQAKTAAGAAAQAFFRR